MTEIYSCNDYREALKKILEQLTLRGNKVSSQTLAEYAGIQPPYLSKVFNGKAELNSDQLYLICEKLEISGDEEDYLKLLLENSRSGLKRRKDQLKNQIKRIQNEKLSPTTQREKMAVSEFSENLAQYYLDPQMQQVHMCLLIPKLRNNPNAIAEKLRLDPDRLSQILKLLENLKIIEIKNKSYVVLKEQMHLPKKHPLCPSHQNLLRIASAQRLQLNQNDAFSFMATFTADEKTKNQIQQGFMNFLKTVESLVEKAPSEDVFHVQFDLFNW